MTKLAIVGGRDFDNYSLLKEEIKIKYFFNYFWRCTRC